MSNVPVSSASVLGKRYRRDFDYKHLGPKDKGHPPARPRRRALSWSVSDHYEPVTTRISAPIGVRDSASESTLSSTASTPVEAEALRSPSPQAQPQVSPRPSDSHQGPVWPIVPAPLPSALASCRSRVRTRRLDRRRPYPARSRSPRDLVPRPRRDTSESSFDRRQSTSARAVSYDFFTNLELLRHQCLTQRDPPPFVPTHPAQVSAPAQAHHAQQVSHPRPFSFAQDYPRQNIADPWEGQNIADPWEVPPPALGSPVPIVIDSPPVTAPPFIVFGGAASAPPRNHITGSSDVTMSFQSSSAAVTGHFAMRNSPVEIWPVGIWPKRFLPAEVFARRIFRQLKFLPEGHFAS